MIDAPNIRQIILDEHRHRLGDRLVALISCGSLGEDSKEFSERSDIDFVAVTYKLDWQTLDSTAAARSNLSKLLPVSVSNSLITSDEVARYVDEPESLNGKATQALLEAAMRTEYILWAKQDFMLSLPSDEAIRRYSVLDFYRLANIMRSFIIRSEPGLSTDLQYKLAKISSIALKLKLQFDEPHRFIDPAGGGFAAPLSEADSSFYGQIQIIKQNPKQVGAEEQVALLTAFLTDAQRQFQSTV